MVMPEKGTSAVADNSLIILTAVVVFLVSAADSLAANKAAIATAPADAAAFTRLFRSLSNIALSSLGPPPRSFVAAGGKAVHGTVKKQAAGAHPARNEF